MLMSQAAFHSGMPVGRGESGFCYLSLPISKLLLGLSQNKKKWKKKIYIYENISPFPDVLSEQNDNDTSSLLLEHILCAK